MNFEEIKDLKKICISAGASAPEILVQKVIDYFKENFDNVETELFHGITEDTFFFLPKELRDV